MNLDPGDIGALLAVAVMGAVLAYNHRRNPDDRPEPQIGVHERWDEQRRAVASQRADDELRDRP